MRARIYHVEPIHHHHGFDEIASQIAMPAGRLVCLTVILFIVVFLPSIVHIRLNTHVVGSKMLDTSTAVLNSYAIFVYAKRLVALTDEPFIRLISTSGIWRNDKSWPQSVLLFEIRELLGHRFL